MHDFIRRTCGVDTVGIVRVLVVEYEAECCQSAGRGVFIVRPVEANAPGLDVGDVNLSWRLGRSCEIWKCGFDAEIMMSINSMILLLALWTFVYYNSYV